jgi:carbamoyltransferase
MSITILGISAFFHDSAAVLLKDGEIIAAAQEERFTRKKGDAGFPKNAVSYCIEEAAMKISDIDFVTFYEKPHAKFDRLFETYRAYAPRGFRSFLNAMPLWANHRLHMTERILQSLDGSFRGKLYYADHHESHAASAFFPSPFDQAAILTVDAVGEWSTSCIGRGEKNRIELVKELRFPHSLGMLYSAFTYYCGFKVNSGEYKLMGLAPYGEPRYVDVIKERIVDIYEDGSIWLDMAYFNYCEGFTMTSEKFHKLFDGQPRNPESMITQKEMDIAASIQVVTEEIMLNMARFTRQETGMKNLVMAGGVALNCVANGKILRDGPFENIWIQPAAGDAGGALGAAYLVWHHLLGNDRIPDPLDSQKGSLLGPSFDDDVIRHFLDGIGAPYTYVQEEDALLDLVSDYIADEKVIGWFQGRMEYGPRALGCRSIIGDARSTKMQQIMNLKIKYRESFRPFAPCVLREHVHEIFDMREYEDSPYMLLVAPVREELRLQLSEDERLKLKDPDLRVRVSVPRSIVPAITHVDYSARVQTVDKDRHGRYYRLMKRFYEKTGCPVIVNTSFNIRGEPIVCTYEEALRCFMATEMDYLVLGNFILNKEDQAGSFVTNLLGIEAYKESVELD